jgi:hypothetical protein
MFSISERDNMASALFHARRISSNRRKAFVNEKTCAACDCKLDSNSIKVKLRAKVVEVCCTECAEKLKEAQDSAAARDEP